MINGKTFFWTTTLIGVVVLATRWHTIYGYSVDLGLHHALANELFELLGRADLRHEHLGPMFNYPSGSHWLAAMLSVATSSPLVSLNLIALSATYLGYVAMALFLVDDEKTLMSFVRLGIFLVATWLLATMQAAFGYQAVLNFFFPQLLGEAIVLIALYMLSRERLWKLPVLHQILILVAGTWLFAYVQPLAALQFGGSVIVYRLFDSVVVDGKLRIRLRALLATAAFSAPIVVAVLLHPAFRTMIGIAANDGYLQFGGWLGARNSYLWLAGFSIAAAALAIVGVARHRLNRRPALLLAAAATAGAILLLIQKINLVFWGMGSEYAIGKHVFFLASMSALTLTYSVRWRGLRALPRSRNSGAVLPPLFAVAALAVVFANAPTVWRQELGPLLQYQAYAKHFHRYLTPIDGERNVVSLNEDLTPVFNHLVSMGNLKLPYDLANASIASSGLILATPVKYALVSSRRLYRDVQQLCAVAIPPSPTYAAVDRVCFLDALSVMAIGVPLKTASNQRGSEYLTHGWSRPETWGTWSASESPRIEFSVRPESGSGPYLMRVKYLAFIAGSRQQQSFSIVVDGKLAGDYLATSAEAREVGVPVGGPGRHTIEFRVDNPVSPRQLGMSANDERRLGIGIVELQLDRM